MFKGGEENHGPTSFFLGNEKCLSLIGQVQVQPTVETTPVTHGSDAADDPAIWVHPTTPANSFFIGTDKDDDYGALELYGLDGIRFNNTGDDKKYNNVDVRYDFPFNGGNVDIVTVSNRTDNRVEVFRIDPVARTLVNITGSTSSQVGDSYQPYGYAMYHNPVTNKFYGFTSCRKKVSGDYPIRQWEFEDNGSQGVDATLVRTLTGFTQVEGIVGDDMLGYVYIAEEDGEIRKYGANPGDGQTHTVVDKVDASGTITHGDIEGLTMYYTSKNEGYLLASWQGSNEFLIYDRISNSYIGNFEIIANSPIGAVSQTDGIDVISYPLGTAFPKGAFICHDGQNGTYSNFKVVPWESIAAAFDPDLAQSTVVNPRAIGKQNISWTGTSTDWGATGNWDAGAVPFDYNDVTIPNVANGPQISSAELCDGLTVQTGASLTILKDGSLEVSGTLTNQAGNTGIVINSDATGTGALSHVTSGVSGTVQRFLAQDFYHYISSPVQNVPISLLQSGTPHTDFDLFWYDEDNSGGQGPLWVDASGQSGNMVNALGYSYSYLPNDITISFAGQMNSGNINVPISYTYDATVSTNTWYFGWNIVGNPYPSPIDAGAFLDGQTDNQLYGTLYFWSEKSGSISSGDYAAWNTLGGTSGGSGVEPNGIIEVGQAFMVHTFSTSAQVNFTNGMRTVNEPEFFKKRGREASKLKLKLKNDNYSSDILIGLTPGATNGFDNSYDAFKFSSGAPVSFYSNLIEDNDNNYSIQGIPYPESEQIIPLGFDIDNAGDYQIETTSVSGFNGYGLLLYDSWLSSWAEIKTGAIYHFNASVGGCFNDRFKVHIKAAPAHINENDNNNAPEMWQVFLSKGIIYTGLDFESNPDLKWS
ncbi:MAG: hypothetical protein B6I19_01565 [Bacteroidetes bacterium 4572_114]|nr:MAG: hypothetical protein B6I19_01565 [Bacteroidetes bacterium 4572_114]